MPDNPANPTVRKLPPWLRRLIAFLHLSDRIVCEESAGLGLVDYHDYPDDVNGEPWHFAELTCKRCGKTFTI